MESLWRLTRRFLFLFVTLVVASNTIAYVVLNNKFVHEWMHKEINDRLFMKYGLLLSIDTVSLNFLETKLTLRDVGVRDLNNESLSLLSINDLSIGFDPWNRLSTWIPKARYIAVNDWKLNPELKKYFPKGQSTDPETKIDLDELLSSLRPYIGQQLEFKNGTIQNGEPGGNGVDLNLSTLFFKYNSIAAKDGVTFVLEARKSRICSGEVERCAVDFQFDNLNMNVTHAPNNPWRVERFETVGTYGSWSAKGDLSIAPHLAVSQYSFDVQGSANASKWFALAGLEGSGQFKANLKISNQRRTDSRINKIFPQPVVEGKASWSDLRLSGYDVYTGEADVAYSDETIRYSNAAIRTPSGARIDAQGTYVLVGKMPYKNSAKIVQFPFTELMAGLRVPTNAMDFLMATDDLHVTGELNPGREKGFSLVVEGLVVATRLVTPSFEPNKRKLPSCHVNLRLQTDSNAMRFEGSSAFCAGIDGQLSTRIILQRGILDYLTLKDEFKFVVTGGDASVISYFVDEQIEGRFDLRGAITSSSKKPVTFTADVQLNEGKVVNLAANRVSGNIELSGAGLKASGVEGWFDDEGQSPNVSLKTFSLGFKDRSLKLEGALAGKLPDFVSLLPKEARVGAGVSEGSVRVSKIFLAGKTNQIEKGVIQADVQIKGLSSSLLKAKEVKATISCQQGWCSGSRLFAHDLALGEAAVIQAKKGDSRKDSLYESTAVVEFDSLSERALSLRADLQSVPFTLRTKEKNALSGRLDLRGAIQGGKNDWELTSSARVDGLRLFDVPLGSVVVNATSHGGGPINLVAAGLFDQIQARLILDHQLQKSTQLYLNMRSFEIFKYIGALENMQTRPSGSVTGEFSIDGPGLQNLISWGDDTYRKIVGDGVVTKIDLQTGGEGFSLERPVSVDLSDGFLKFTSMVLKGRSGEMLAQGGYSIPENVFSSRIEGQFDAGILTQWWSGLSQANGNILINSQVELGPSGNKIRGEARAENVFLFGPYLTPPLTSVNGKVVFQDSKIEIPSLTAAKGNGQVDLFGSIDLQPDEELAISEQEPSVAIRMNVRSALFRWPQPVFDTVETNLDGQIELVGRARPYLLNGELRILKGRAYRDATCQELLNVNMVAPSDKSIVVPLQPFAQLNVSLDADNSFTLQTSCIRGRVSSSLKFTGNDAEPVIGGQVRLDNGQLNLLKTRFDVTRADAIFDNVVRTEPRLDAQMVAKIERYNVFVGAEGPLSRPRLNIWSDPSTGPDGTPLSRPTLIRMISTNRGPGETTQTAVTQALANGVVGFFDDPLSQAVSKITRGFVDRFELQPILESGQSSWRARVSRDLGEKFNLGLDLEPNSQSLTGELFINESVNVLGGFDRRSSQIGTYSELKGGFRFQFGGK